MTLLGSLLLLSRICFSSLAFALAPQGDPPSGEPAGEGQAPAQPSNTVEAVYDYIRYSSPKLDGFERELVLGERAVKEIRGWPFQDRLTHHRLFSYPKGNLQHGAYIVAVDDRLLVTELDGIDDFNEILRKEGIRILTEEDASRAAQLFLKTYFSSGSLYYGYDLGVNVINSVDDIKFASIAERDAIARSYKICPPVLTRRGTRYSYVLWSWQMSGNGLLATHEVILDEKRVVDLKTERLKSMVGEWMGDR
jgi:hypothetical protein